MATFEDIAKANKAIKTEPVKGKDYAMVNQRVKAFRMVYPEGSITTEILKLESGVVYMKATCTDEAGTVLSTGHAYEKESNGLVNKESFIENCETSAVGRALGMAGFGIDTSICSAEELQNALLNQGEGEKQKAEVPPEEVDSESTIADSPSAIKNIKSNLKLIEKLGDTSFMEELRRMYDINKIEDIKKKDFRDVVQFMQARYDILKEGKDE